MQNIKTRKFADHITCRRSRRRQTNAQIDFHCIGSFHPKIEDQKRNRRIHKHFCEQKQNQILSDRYTKRRTVIPIHRLQRSRPIDRPVFEYPHSQVLYPE